MDWILGLVAVVAGVFVFIHAVTLIVVSSRLIKLQFWTPEIVRTARDGAGGELALFDAARQVLEGAGFCLVSSRRVRSFIASATMPPSFSDTYYHPQHDVHAEVHAGSLPTPRHPFDVFLISAYTDGRILLSTNWLSKFLTPYPRRVTITDACAPNFQTQLAAHLAERERFTGQRIDPEAAPDVAAALAREMLPSMVNEGQAYVRGQHEGETVYSLRLATAVNMAWRMRSAMAQRKRMDQAAPQGGLPPELATPEVRHAAERNSFVRALCTMHGAQVPRWFRWSAFTVSAAAFIGLGAWWWDLNFALVIAAVIAVHEAGHWLAMRMANFNGVQVFFIPGMGGATSGEKHDAHPLTHLAVFLAGPMPGLLFAVGAFAWLMSGAVDPGAWWHAPLGAAAGAALFINLFNLLPMMPLDGGRIVDLFVMARLPWIRFAFALLSGCLLAWAGMAGEDKVLLGLGMLALVYTPHQYRLAKVSRDFLRQKVAAPLASEGFADAAARLFDFLAQPAYRSWPHQVKVGVGQAILPRYLGRLPALRATILGLTIYIACILLPLLAIASLAARDPDRLISLAFGRSAQKVEQPRAAVPQQDPVRALRKQREAALAAADPAQRLRIMADLVDDARMSEDYADNLRLAKLLYAETRTLPAPAREHADAASRLALALLEEGNWEDQAGPNRLFLEAESGLRARLARQVDATDALALAEVLDYRMDLDKSLDAVRTRQEIADLHAAHQEKSGTALPNARVKLARALDKAGDAGAAERALQEAQQDLMRLPAAPADARQRMLLDHASFLMAHQRPDDALAQLTPLLSALAPESRQWFSSQHEAYLLAAALAGMRKDWKGMKTRAEAIHVFAPVKSGSWIVDLLSTLRPAPARFDLRASLLLIEAERALGEDLAANELAAALRLQYQGKNKGPVRCRLGAAWDPWRADLTAALLANEQRELGCTQGAPP